MNIRKIYGQGLLVMAKLFGVGFAKKFDTLVRFHRTLNLKNPLSLADKIVWIELFHQPSLYVRCSDKIAVREYVAEKGFSDILVPVCGSGKGRDEVYSRENGGGVQSVDEINFHDLPRSYVIKANHGCKMNYFVPDSDKLDLEDCKRTLTKWLQTDYGAYSMEFHYLRIPHRLYIEKFLPDADNIVDYKFHCLNGKPEFVLVCSNRKIDHNERMSVTFNTFDMNWNFIDEMIPSGNEIPGDGKISCPQHFEEMKTIATILAQDFDFVRVDLFDLGGKVYFGELTFTPACGVFPYYTEKFLLEMGRKMKFDKCLND